MQDDLHKLRVLIVDDEPLIRSCVRFEVELMGCQVFEVECGQDAEHFLKQTQVDLVLSDIRMPRGDGIELLKFVKNNFSSIPMFLMSGFADIPLWDAYDHGAEAFIGKPFEVERLELLLKRIFRTARQDWSDEVSGIEPVAILKYEQFELGRGGAFFRDVGLNFKRDMVISFATEAETKRLEGNGIVRWVRRQRDETLAAGCGVEFLGLSPSSSAWVKENIDRTRPKAFIPRGS